MLTRVSGRAIRNIVTGAALLLVLAATAAAVRTPSAQADQGEEGVLPICAPTTNADPAWDPRIEDWHLHVQENTQVGPTDQWVGRGLAQGCAYQSWFSSEEECDGEGSCHPGETIFFHPFVHGYAFPDTFDAADGDHQRVTITIPGTAPYLPASEPGVGWGACFPGFKWHEPLNLTGCDPNGWQYDNENEVPTHPGTTDSFPEPGGAMSYRPRSPGGNFSGEWTTSLGDASPGFHLQHVGTPCTTSDTSCEYELDFTRDPTGQLQVTQDMQVVLEIEATVLGDEGPLNETEAIPMLVIQTGGNGTPGGGTPGGGDGSGGGSGGSGGGGGGSGGGGGPTPGPAAACTVPRIARLKVAQAKRALLEARCKVGAARHAYSKAVRKGLVIAATPATGSKVSTSEGVGYTISRGPRPHRPARRPGS